MFVVTLSLRLGQCKIVTLSGSISQNRKQTVTSACGFPTMHIQRVCRINRIGGSSYVDVQATRIPYYTVSLHAMPWTVIQSVRIVRKMDAVLAGFLKFDSSYLQVLELGQAAGSLLSAAIYSQHDSAYVQNLRICHNGTEGQTRVLLTGHMPKSCWNLRNLFKFGRSCRRLWALLHSIFLQCHLQQYLMTRAQHWCLLRNGFMTMYDLQWGVASAVNITLKMPNNWSTLIQDAYKHARTQLFYRFCRAV